MRKEASLRLSFGDALLQVLLDNASGRITTGLYAVMGPSGKGSFTHGPVQVFASPSNSPGPVPLTAGSGKTTLLNTLACRLDHNVKVPTASPTLLG
jgi:hypothetical protein